MRGAVVGMSGGIDSSVTAWLGRRAMSGDFRTFSIRFEDAEFDEARFQQAMASSGGQPNPSFLDAALFENAFLRALEPYRSQVGVLIFEFGTFSRAAYPDAGDFVAELDRFLASIPRTFRYSVEIRNPEYLKPRYFDCLRSHGVAHVFNAWTRMPDIGQQTGIPGAFTAGFTVCRALLSRGRTYEEAVKKFSPYEKVQEPNPEARESLRSLIRRARASACCGSARTRRRTWR